MFRDIEIQPEEEERIILRAAELIKKYGMETIGIMMLETIKPLSFFGGQMGRLFVSPFIHLLGDDIDIGGEKLLRVFEKEKNVEKLIKLIEEN